LGGTFIDTSVLVPAVIAELPQHALAHARFVAEIQSAQTIYCSSHTLAECYATLTALPLKRRVSAPEAARLIQVNFAPKLEVIDLQTDDYTSAIELCSNRGRISGQIYDALHLIAAHKTGCDKLLTYNLAHFRPLAFDDMIISSP